jgi:Na+-driven multidrug efflux pump
MLRIRVLNGLMLQTAMAVTATAALSVLNTVLNVTSCVMGGMGMTCSIIAGLVSGKQDRDQAEELVKVTTGYALLIAGILFLILFPFAPAITSVFSEGGASTEMAALVIRGLRIYALGLFLFGINVAFINYSQGMRRMAVATPFNFLENFVFIVLAALVLFPFLNIDAVWISYPVNEVLVFAAMFLFMSFRKRKPAVKFADYTFFD